MRSWQRFRGVFVCDPGPAAAHAPNLQVVHCIRYQPRLPSIVESFCARSRELASRLHDLGCRHYAPSLREPIPRYLPANAAFCRVSFYLHRSHEAPLFRGLGRLTVQNRCAGLLVALERLSDLCSQRIMNLAPSAIDSPGPKVMVNRLPLWKVMWHQPPLAPTSQYIQNSINDFSAAMLTRMTSRLDLRNQRFKNLPFVIFQIGIVLFSLAHLPLA